MAARTRSANGRGSAPFVALGRREQAMQERGAVVEVGVVPLEAGAVVVLHEREADGAGSAVFRRSLTNTRLPSDFDIFSPS